MKTSQRTIDTIKQFESCRLTAYQDTRGIWTIGYGHTGNVRRGQVITQEQAEKFFIKDLEKFEKNVEKYNGIYNWNQNEFDALVSFAYNVGSIDQLTAKGKRSREEIAEKMMKYVKSGENVSRALKRRREAERELFLMPCCQGAENDAGETDSGIVEYSYKLDAEKQISRNFKVKEFRCKDGCDKILIDVGFVSDKLQAIRDYFGAAVTVNSAYRTAAYNRKVGGASKSYHMTGQAFDIVVKGYAPSEVAKCAQSLGINGIIQYNGFVHVDSRDKKYWAHDNNGKITKKESF